MNVETIESDRQLISFWDFATEVYSRKGVEQLCLQLQDEYHANVNIILWCLWLKHKKLRLSSRWLDDVLINIDTVSLQTVSHLRDARRELKRCGAFSAGQVATISKHIRNAELLTERVLIHKLEEMTKRFVALNERELEQEPSLLDLNYYLTFIQVPRSDFVVQQFDGVFTPMPVNA